MTSSSCLDLGAGPAGTAVKREAAVALPFADLFPEGSSDLPSVRLERFLFCLRTPDCVAEALVGKPIPDADGYMEFPDIPPIMAMGPEG